MQDDYLSSMQQRLDRTLSDGAELAGRMADGHCEEALSRLSSWGPAAGTPPSLTHFVVELDQRFLTDLGHTAAMFTELFGQAGRPRMLKATRF